MWKREYEQLEPTVDQGCLTEKEIKVGLKKMNANKVTGPDNMHFNA